MAGTLPSGSKKRRLPGSCHNCRVRKVKCDAAQRVGYKCSNCVKFDVACTHVAAMSKKNRVAPPYSNSQDIPFDDLQAQIYDILNDTVPYVISKDTRIVHSLLTELARYARSLEVKLAEAERLVQELKSGVSSSCASSEVDLQLMETPMSRLEISENEHILFGAKIDAQLTCYAQDMKKDIDPMHTSLRPEFWYPRAWHYPPKPGHLPLEFPPPDLLDALVSIFFQTTNRHICLLHGPTLMRQVAEGLHHTSLSFGSVILAVCALASPYSNDPRVGEGPAIGWRWYKQLRPVGPEQPIASETALWDLQLFPLMALHAYVTNSPQTMFLSAMGIRMGQGMHLNRMRRKDTVTWTPNDELHKRAWWALLNIEGYSSCVGGRMPVTNPDEYDTEYPLEVDDEYWPGEVLADPRNPWLQPSNTPSILTNWILHMKLLDICNFAQRTIYTIRRSDLWDSISTTEWNQNVAVALDSALNEWLDSVPHHLRWNPHGPTDHAAMLYSTYYWVQIQVHRPFLHTETGFSSSAICATAARSCIHVIVNFERAFGTFATVNMHSSLLYASVVLLSYAKKGLASARDFEDIRNAMLIFERHEDRFPVAGRYHDVIRDIYEVLRPQAFEGLTTSYDARKRKDRQESNEWELTTIGPDFLGVKHNQSGAVDFWDGWNIVIDS